MNSSAIVFTDYKPLGSRTCYAQCVHTSKQLGIDKRLKSLGVEVNPKLKNSITSSLRSVSGFVSNVEQELLSQADFLILTGFGGFQVVIREYGSTLYVGLARAVSPTNTNFRLTFLLTRLQEALYEDLAV